MKAKLLAAALLLAATPASAVTVTWELTQSQSVINPGSTVDFHLHGVVGPPDPGFYYATFNIGPSAYYSDGQGNDEVILNIWGGLRDFDWSVTYPASGLYVLNWLVSGEISEGRTCTLTGTCNATTDNSGRIYHVNSAVTGQADVLVVPGPAVGAGLPGLLVLLALWRRRRCARSC